MCWVFREILLIFGRELCHMCINYSIDGVSIDCALESSFHNQPMVPDQLQKAVRWHPPSYDIRVEDVPAPQLVPLLPSISQTDSGYTRIQDPNDAIVRVKVCR